MSNNIGKVSKFCGFSEKFIIECRAFKKIIKQLKLPYLRFVKWDIKQFYYMNNGVVDLFCNIVIE